MHPTARRSAGVAAGALAVLVAVSCSVYDPSLLGAGALDLGSSGTTGQSGTSGATGNANAGTGDGGLAGEADVNGGSTGTSAGGQTGAGGLLATSGAGGNAATGGSAGNAGTGDAAGAGGSAGNAGTGGAAGAGATANGCAKLSVPLASAADKAHFVISLTSPADLSQATISMRVYVRAGSGGSIFNYVQDSGTYHFFGVPVAERAVLSNISGWSTVTWGVGAEADSGATGIVKTSIKNIGIEVNAQPSSSWLNPTIIYIDSITITTPALSFTFDGSSSIYPTPTTAAATGQALWTNSGATDTTAVGVTLGWQATCP
jgi:hypothetical protein